MRPGTLLVASLAASSGASLLMGAAEVAGSGGVYKASFYIGVWALVAFVAAPVCLLGIVVAEQVLRRADPRGNLSRLPLAITLGGAAGTLVCLPFVPSLHAATGAVFGAACGLAVLYGGRFDRAWRA